MTIVLAERVLYIILRRANGDRLPVGLVLKLKRDRMYSERAGRWRGWCVGPLYIRTYRRAA
jgi:hypothetical protein